MLAVGYGSVFWCNILDDKTDSLTKISSEPSYFGSAHLNVLLKMKIDSANKVILSLRKYGNRTNSDLALATEAADSALLAAFMFIVLGTIFSTDEPIGSFGFYASLACIGFGLISYIGIYRRVAATRDLLIKKGFFSVEDMIFSENKPLDRTSQAQSGQG